VALAKNEKKSNGLSKKAQRCDALAYAYQYNRR
jgi:hypothetical protein